MTKIVYQQLTPRTPMASVKSRLILLGATVMAGAGLALLLNLFAPAITDAPTLSEQAVSAISQPAVADTQPAITATPTCFALATGGFDCGGEYVEGWRFVNGERFVINTSIQPASEKIEIGYGVDLEE